MGISTGTMNSSIIRTPTSIACAAEARAWNIWSSARKPGTSIMCGPDVLPLHPETRLEPVSIYACLVQQSLLHSLSVHSSIELSVCGSRIGTPPLVSFSFLLCCSPTSHPLSLLSLLFSPACCPGASFAVVNLGQAGPSPPGFPPIDLFICQQPHVGMMSS